MHDLHLLVLLGDREQYDRYLPYVKDSTCGKETMDIVSVLGEFYKNYPTTTKVNWSEFASFYMLIKGKTKPERLSVIGDVLRNIEVLSREIDAGTAKTVLHEDVVMHYVKLDYATKIAGKALEIVNKQVSSGESDSLETIGDLVSDYAKASKRAVSPEELFVDMPIASMASTVLGGGLLWPLKELNVSLGPLRKGDFIVVAARPETGKSTFGAQVATCFAQQFDPADPRPLLYVGNEEASSKVSYRLKQSYFGVPTGDLTKNAADYDAKWSATLSKRIRVLSDEAGISTVGHFKKLFRDINPQVIIFDQLDNVGGYSHEDKEHMRIGLLYRWARNLAKEYGPVIAMSQINGSGEGQQWLTMAQLRESSTDKPAAADAIITIGRVNDKSKEYCRYIHIPKNKLLGLPGMTEEAFRHGYHEVTINPAIGRYVGSMK